MSIEFVRCSTIVFIWLWTYLASYWTWWCITLWWTIENSDVEISFNDDRVRRNLYFCSILKKWVPFLIVQIKFAFVFVSMRNRFQQMKKYFSLLSRNCISARIVAILVMVMECVWTIVDAGRLWHWFKNPTICVFQMRFRLDK